MNIGSKNLAIKRLKRAVLANKCNYARDLMMAGPDFLTDELEQYRYFNNDEQLFNALIQSPLNAVNFLEQCCEDTLWRSQHYKIIQQLVRWSAKGFYLGHLSTHLAKKVVRTIYCHNSFLLPTLLFQASLFHTFRFQVQGKTFLGNALLFGTSCPFFYDLIKNQFNHFHDEWILSQFSIEIFEKIQTFIMQGSLPYLWKETYEEIEQLMREAKRLSLNELVLQCVEVMKRYLTKDNMIEHLQSALQKNDHEWRRQIESVANESSLGLKFHDKGESHFAVEVADQTEETIHRFKILSHYVTDLVFPAETSHAKGYAELIDLCPELIGVDLSTSTDDYRQFDDLPSGLIELDLSSCRWVGPEHLREASYQFPALKKLNLSYNPQLTLSTWAELNRFKHLDTLNVSGCYQIDDEALKLIARNSPYVVDLNLEGCRNMTDKGIGDLLSIRTGIVDLNLSYCSELTDLSLKTLANQAFFLTHLALRGLEDLSEKSIEQLLLTRSQLKSLDIRQTSISLKTLAKWQRSFPELNIEG